MMMMNEGDGFDDDDGCGVKIERSVIWRFIVNDGSTMDEGSEES